MLRFRNIQISENGIQELQDNRVVLTAPLADLLNVKLKYGSGSQRPLASLIFGIFLIALGLAPWVLVFFNNPTLIQPQGMGKYTGGQVVGYLLYMCVLTIPCGIWLIYRTFDRRWYLHLQMHSQTEKAVIDNEIDVNELRSFLESAKKKYAIPIDV